MRQISGVALFRNRDVFIHDFPNMMGSGEGLLHAVLKTGEFAHWIVTSKQEEEKSHELRSVHSPGDDLVLTEEEKQHDEQYSNHLNCRRRSSRNACTPKIGPYDRPGDFGKTHLLSLL